MKETSILARAGLAAVASWPLAGARAEIHDHEIRRLLYLHSSCGVINLVRAEDEGPSRRFKADCQNVSAFPEGLEVSCADINDDRSCRIDTKPKEFRDLPPFPPSGAAPP